MARAGAKRWLGEQSQGMIGQIVEFVNIVFKDWAQNRGSNEGESKRHGGWQMGFC